MNFFKKLLKYFLILAVVLVAGIAIFVSTAPQFGAAAEGTRLARMKASPEYRDGTFTNLIPTSMDMSAGKMVETMEEFITAKNTRPDQPLSVDFADKVHLADSLVHITWFGLSLIHI